MLINITGSSRLGLHEVNQACSIIREAADNDEVQISFGVILDEAMEDAVKITVIATGFPMENAPATRQPARARAAADENASAAEEPEVSPEPAESEPEPEAVPAHFDANDLEVPAYLRQGKLLN
jgi:cell division protein FtsZ